MEDLRVIGVEDGAIVVSSDQGTHFRLAVDDNLRMKLGQASGRSDTARPGSSGSGSSGGSSGGSTSSVARKVSPREIQGHIRAGMSAEDVAAVTGAPLEYIEKFERPVLAEREYIIESALNVPVHTAMDADPMSDGSTFGFAIRERLQGLGATDERWASWKEAAGEWVVKLSFTVGPIDHDARWQYEPKRATLAPLNGEANTLSQQGEMPGALIPRLRAVGGEERIADSSRFDSGAFDLRSGNRGTAPQPTVSPFGRSTESSPQVTQAAINRAPADEVASSQTADLLDALRRRRGERESAAAWTDEDAARSTHPAAGGVRLVDVPLDDFDSLGGDTGAVGPVAGHAAAASGTSAEGQHASELSSPAQSQTGPQHFTAQARGGRRQGRAAMPSWDEIVFGARSEDDPA